MPRNTYDSLDKGPAERSRVFLVPVSTAVVWALSSVKFTFRSHRR